MLVSHHATLSTLAALSAAPLVRRKEKLALFLASAVGQDVDHYLWHALRFRNPSLRDAYRYFRGHYPRPPHEFAGRGKIRYFHGFEPLALALLATAVDRRAAPIALGMAFHGLLDALNEFVILPATVRGYRAPRLKLVAPSRKDGVVAKAEAEALAA